MLPQKSFLSKNSGTSNTVTTHNGKTTTNVLNWNAESDDNITKILYELNTNGKSKYAEVELPTNTLKSNGSIHKRLINDYSNYLSDSPSTILMKSSGGSRSTKPPGARVGFMYATNSSHRKLYRKTPKYKNTTKRRQQKTRRKQTIIRGKTRKNNIGTK